MNKLFKFQHGTLQQDQVNDKGKITKYFEVNVISSDEESARIKGKLDQDYILVEVKELGKDWN